MSANTNELEGWYKFSNAAKWHYMRAGRSLCGKWGMLARMDPGSTEPFDESSTKPGPDDCVSCWRKRKADKKNA